MNPISLVTLLFCASAALAATTLNTDIGCQLDTLSAENYDVVIDRRVYADTHHVYHFVHLTVHQLTMSWSARVCFDTPQCLTAGLGYFTYTVPGNGVFCFDLVPPKDKVIKLDADGKTYFGFHTYGPSGPGNVSTLQLNGNGVIEGMVPVQIPPSLPQDYCTFCDGAIIPDLTNCARFHRCFAGQVITMDCPFFTYYDSGLQTCNWQPEAGCYATQKLGQRRTQCSGDACPAGSDAGEKLYAETYHVSACTHSDTPAPAPTTTP